MIFFIPFLASCSIFNEKAIEDFIEGEAHVAETVIGDIAGTPSTPANPPH